MAASFWESTQHKHWQFTKDELSAMRQKLEDEDPTLVQMFPLPSIRHLGIFFNQRMWFSFPRRVSRRAILSANPAVSQRSTDLPSA